MIAIAQAAVPLATSTRYGYHRDELYFIVAGSHVAFGYPDQPPLVPLVSWAMNALAPGSLLLLRTPSALAAAATTTPAAQIARELGGQTRAQVIAAACTAVSGFALAVAHLVTTTTPDLLNTTVLGVAGGPSDRPRQPPFAAGCRRHEGTRCGGHRPAPP